MIHCLSHARATAATATGDEPLPPDLSKTGCWATAAGQEGVEVLTLYVEKEIGHRHRPGVRGEYVWNARRRAEERGVG